MKIAKEMLQEIEACKEGRSAFALLFPSGATWDEVVAAGASTPLHRGWLAVLGRWCPVGVEGATWVARLAVQRTDDERAWVAARWGATKEMKGESNGQ